MKLRGYGLCASLSFLCFVLNAAFADEKPGKGDAPPLDVPPLTRSNAPHNANPILPGYYADPSVLQYEGKYYIYATLDPWGGETLGCWESSDFKHWTYRVLNWPTKKAATSANSASAMVWAPSVVRATNGKLYMYVSVGSEVWVGTADHPLGPWRNALGDRPLIPATWNRAYHMIDAEAFIDDDGHAYLYWGSGWNWKNGRCFAVRLKPDMISFDGEPRDVTPANYFEGPFLFKHSGRYYLMYSSGKTTEDSYRVHYATGTSPFGPFTEGTNSPILVSNPEHNILGPGHHAVFVNNRRTYIAYHRHSIPFQAGAVHRQVCIDELLFEPNGEMKKVVPTHMGPALVQRWSQRRSLSEGAKVTASSALDEAHGAAVVGDDNYATRWSPADNDCGAWLQLDLGSIKPAHSTELRFEYAWKPYRFLLETSADGKTWKIAADYRQSGISGSPIVISKLAACRYMRLVFPEDVAAKDISLFEWQVY